MCGYLRAASQARPKATMFPYGRAAMFNVPKELNLPCHRVVNSQGRLAPNWAEQRGLLEKEGITFKKNGCVDLKKHIWEDILPII